MPSNPAGGRLCFPVTMTATCTLLTVAVFVIVCASTCVTGLVLVTCNKLNPTEDGELKFKSTLQNAVVTGNEDEYMGLFCHAHNYCQITWKKNGQLIHATDRIHIEENGQKLQIRKIQKSDASLYSCEASNGGVSINRTIEFRFISKDCDVKVLPFKLQDNACQNVTANLGEDVKFDCLFYISNNYAELESDWYKFNKSAAEDDRWIYLDNSTAYSMSSYFKGDLRDNSSNCACADCLLEFGTILTIRSISASAYGRYRLYITNTGYIAEVILTISHAPNITIVIPTITLEVWNHALITPLVSFGIVCLVVFLVWQRFKIDIKLSWKKNYTAKSWKDCSRENDAYLSYDWNSEADRAFAISLQGFLTKLGYRVFFEAHCLPGGVTDEDILKALETSYRCVMIFSPDYLASYRKLDVVFAMDNIKNSKKEIIPIIYRDISAVAEEEKSTLVRHIMSVPCLHYDRIPSEPLSKLQRVSQRLLGIPRSENALHNELLLRLPPLDRQNQQSAPWDTDSVSDLIPEIPLIETNLYPDISGFPNNDYYI